MGTSSPELFLALDRSRPRKLRVQIEDGLRTAIRAGRLGPDAAVPSTRALAADLGVTRKVVVEAYDQLIAEGYLISRRGAATVVNPAMGRRQPPSTAPTKPAAVTVDFRPGRPDLGLFPRAAWLRANRTALRDLPTADLAYADARGLPVLRAALSEYLARVRGVNADPERIIVCAGFAHAVDLIASALADVGRTEFAVESPGYPGPRKQLDAMGLRYTGVPVDADGLVVERLAETDARSVIVTPAHQSPTGVVLSAERRQQLLDWARSVDGYVVEDDYDAEFRYDRRPVGALQGVAPDRVVYCGTTSKTLASGVRLGWIVAPAELVEPMLLRRELTDGATATVLQAAFAQFLADGDLDRHLRRARHAYRERRDAIVAAVAELMPGVRVSGVSAGLNVLLTLPEGTDEAAVIDRALAVGVRVYPYSWFQVAGPARPGLILGYGSVQAPAAVDGIRLLAGVLNG